MVNAKVPWKELIYHPVSLNSEKKQWHFDDNIVGMFDF